MTQHLSVSRAARLAGVSRSEIQGRIRGGQLHTFEGKVAIDDLLGTYPGIELEDSSVLERMARNRKFAVYKQPDVSFHKRNLVEEIGQLRLEVEHSRAELEHYKSLVASMKERLESIQRSSDCTREQKLVLQALVSWMIANTQRRV
ncbi:MAG: DUF3450 domain-containing protein [Gammaproteobacteria bacterium]|jgi:CDP-4-dehydro-6-deoxyglucose reductase|nr:DUF3450 domain-containing protein [Gammaproteobacteria bacterium]